MALMLNSTLPKTFFETVFGASSATAELTEALMKAGFKFKITLYSVGVTLPLGGILAHPLSCGSSTLMKNPFAKAAIVAVTKDSLAKFIASLAEMYDLDAPLVAAGAVDHKAGAAAGVAAPETLGSFLLNHPKIKTALAKAFQEPLNSESEKESSNDGAGQTTTVKSKYALALPKWTKNQAPLPVAAVIQLRDATALLQKVKGTSLDSVYHTIALNDRVKVAARITSVATTSEKTVSFRIEMPNATKEEQLRVKQALIIGTGSSWKGNYGSLHITTGNLPLGRVVGAFLMGLGVQFSQQITWEGDLPVDAH